MTHDEIVRLTAAERMSLIAELWDSLSDLDAPLPQAQCDELLRRLGTFESDRRQTQDWDSLKAELDTRKR